jgi:hypothetical protein
MTRDEAIKDACSIVSLDGFCHTCVNKHGPTWGFANQGFVLNYVRRAVVAALKLDGFTIPKGFDPETGKEL